VSLVAKRRRAVGVGSDERLEFGRCLVAICIYS
jgi:hypothetical protein